MPLKSRCHTLALAKVCMSHTSLNIASIDVSLTQRRTNFLEFLKLVTSVYCPLVSGHNSELPSEAEESTGAAGSHVVVSAAAMVDVHTFDLGFVPSLSDDEIQMTVLLPCLCKVTYFWFSTFSLMRK